MFGQILGRSAIVAAALVAVAPAQAADFVFTSTSSTSTWGGNNGYGNTMSFTSGGITAVASAWSTTTGGSTAAAYLGRYTNGLGVTNTNEGNGQASYSHTIDNYNGFDFVALQFSQAVKLTGLNKVNYPINGSTDGDFWISYYNAATNSFVAGTDYASNASISNSAFSTVWLIGASRSDTVRNDGFKLSTVTVTAQVPETATWLMMIGGFGLMGAALRRRSVKVAYAI